MRLVVDRIEDDKAICQSNDFTVIEISVINLPEGTHEGSVLIFENDVYRLDEDYEEELRERIQQKMDDLFID